MPEQCPYESQLFSFHLSRWPEAAARSDQAENEFPPKMEPGPPPAPVLESLPCCALAELQPPPVPGVEDWAASDAWLERAVESAVGRRRAQLLAWLGFTAPERCLASIDVFFGNAGWVQMTHRNASAL